LDKELSQLSSDTNLLISTFVDNEELLKAEGERLISILERNISTSVSHNAKELRDSLQEFTQKLQSFLDQCAEINRISRDLQAIHDELDTGLTNLDNVVAEKTIMIAMEGKEEEAFVIEQLSNILPEYRLTLSQVIIYLNEAKRAHLGFGIVEKGHEHDISTLLDDLSLRLTAVTTTGEDLASLGTQLIENVRRYKEHIVKFYQMAEEFQKRLGEIKRAQEQVIIVMGGIDEQIVQTTGNIQGNIVGVIRSSNRVVVILSVIVVVVMIIGVGYVMKVVQPIKDLARTADQLAEGDIACDIYKIKSYDEIGILSGAFDKLITYLTEMASVATEVSQGDLSRNIRPRSQRDVLGHAFLSMSGYLNEMAEEATAIAAGDLRRDVQPKSTRDALGNAFQQMKELRQSISEIMTAAVQLSSASKELNQVSTEMASAAEQASQQTQIVSSNTQQISENVEAVAIAVEEMSSNIREISHNTNEVSQIVQGAVEMANSANATIADLETRSREIGDVIKVITDITQQTNLLALNATIEAARAGDAGRGFAVVANEIKELSRDTAVSTEDIIHKLESIRSGSQNATRSISEVSNIITQIRDLSVATASSIEEQSVTTSEIARRMGEVSQGSQDVTRVISEVATVTQGTSEGVTDVQDAARNLASLANRLQELVGRFKI